MRRIYLSEQNRCPLWFKVYTQLYFNNAIQHLQIRPRLRKN
jgi:hypothetical protein